MHIIFYILYSTLHSTTACFNRSTVDNTIFLLILQYSITYKLYLVILNRSGKKANSLMRGKRPFTKPCPLWYCCCACQAFHSSMAHIQLQFYVYDQNGHLHGCAHNSVSTRLGAGLCRFQVDKKQLLILHC